MEWGVPVKILPQTHTGIEVPTRGDKQLAVTGTIDEPQKKIQKSFLEVSQKM